MKKLYVKFNLLIDSSDNGFGLSIVLLTVLSILLLQASNNIICLSIGIILLGSIAMMALMRNKWSQKHVDISEYFDLPEPGDIIIVTNPDKFNFHLESQSVYYGPEVKIGDEFQITSVKVKDKRIKIDFRYDSHQHSQWLNSEIAFIDYYQTKKYWATKSDIRDMKLKQLGL
jgi:hypothetical protein